MFAEKPRSVPRGSSSSHGPLFLMFLLFLSPAALLTAEAPWIPLAVAEAPRSEEEIEAQIQDVLMQRHPTDTAEWWRSLGPSTPKVVIRMYEKSSNAYHRLRLIQALGWFPEDAAAVDFLKSQAESTDESVVRLTAIKALGVSQGAKETEFIAKYLRHSDPQTRMAAALALQKMGDARAASIVDQYMKEEKASWIVSRLKGEYPVPTKTLSPVSSSEDRSHPEFFGAWSGYWLVPRAGEDGMRAVDARLELKKENATQMRGDLILTEPVPKKPARTRVFQLSRAEGKGAAMSANLPGEFAGDAGLDSGAGTGLSPRATASPGAVSGAVAMGAAPTPSPQPEIPLKGVLALEAGQWILRMEVPRFGGTLVLRKKSGQR